MKNCFIIGLSVFAFTSLSLNIGTFAQVDGSYMRSIEGRINARWWEPQKNLTHPPVVTFTLDKKGQVSNIKLKESCGDFAGDKLAIDAIHNTAFPPPPGSAPSVTIDFKFELRRHKHSAGNYRLEPNLAWKKAQLANQIEKLQKQLADCEKILGSDSLYLVPVMDELIEVYEDKGEHAKSGELASRALKIREDKLGNLDDEKAKLQIASSLARLGHIYSKQTRYGDAIALYDRSLKIYESVLPNCVQVQEIETEKAKALYVSGKQEESEALYKKLKDPSLAEDKHLKAVNLNNEASKAIIAKQFQQAIAKLQEALNLDAEYKNARENLVVLYLDQGNEDRKKDDYKTAKSCYQAGVQAGKPLVLNRAFIKCFVGVAMMDSKLGNYDDAKSIYEKAIPFFLLENDKTTEKAALEEYALVLRKLGKNNEALEIDQRAKTIETKQVRKTK